jgi:hypothetical protein
MEFRGQKILISDSYLKWIEAWVMSRSDATAVIDKSDSFIVTFEAPNKILSDNALFFDQLCLLLGV